MIWPIVFFCAVSAAASLACAWWLRGLRGCVFAVALAVMYVVFGVAAAVR